MHDEIGGLEGEGPAVTEMLPFLATGKKELIGVTYFETELVVSRESAGDTTLSLVTVPVMATNDFEINVSSSASKSVKPQNAIMKKGENVVLMFGDTGTSAPEGSIEYYITDNDGIRTITSTINGPIEDDLSLQLESLIPIILAGNEFPLAGYLLEAEEDSESTTVDEDEEEKSKNRTNNVY